MHLLFSGLRQLRWTRQVPPAARSLEQSVSAASRVRPPAFFGGVTGHAAYISERLRWQSAFSSEPVLHALGTGVVGRRGEAKVTELRAQFAQKLRRLRQRLGRIERVEQQAFGGGRRHELRDALRPLAAARDG